MPSRTQDKCFIPFNTGMWTQFGPGLPSTSGRGGLRKLPTTSGASTPSSPTGFNRSLCNWLLTITTQSVSIPLLSLWVLAIPVTFCSANEQLFFLYCATLSSLFSLETEFLIRTLCKDGMDQRAKAIKPLRVFSEFF